MTNFNGHAADLQSAVRPQNQRRQFIALWIGTGAILAHAGAWAVVVVATLLAESMLAPSLTQLALLSLAVALVVIGLGLGLTAIIVALRNVPLATPGVIAVILGVAGAVIAVLTFFTMAS